MIESTSTNELMGQYELDDLLDAGEGKRDGEITDGYDAAGNLLNVDATDADDRLSVLATEINAITEQTRGVVISAALAVGKRLVEAKSLCPPGRFGEWLEKSVAYSERKAQDMMRLYVEYGRDGCVPESIAELDYSKAVALLSAPAEAREQLAGKAVEEDLSVRQLNAEIAKLKAEKVKAQMTIDDMSDKLDRQKDEIVRMDENQQNYDRAIVERDAKIKAITVEIEAAKDDLRVAQAKATAAEAAAEQLRKLRSDAEERADKNDQRARDAVTRANKTAVDLSEARARIAELETRAAEAPEPEVRTVEVVPEAVTRELDDLRRQLAEAQANHGTADAPAGPTAVDRFKWFYANQMKPAFTTALTLLQEVAREDGHAASLFATALNKGCKQLMDQLGTSAE